MKLRTFLLWCLLAVSALAAPSAFAATTCTASAPDIVVSGYDGTAQAAANTNVTVTCNTGVTSLFDGTAYVTLCLYVGNTPRTLQNGSNSLSYDLYTSAGTVWQGNSASPPAQQIFKLSYPVGGFIGSNVSGSGQVTVPITARIPAQSGLAAGTYTQALTANTSEYQSSEPAFFGGGSSQPASCKGGSAGPTFPFNVSANVAPRCVIKTATDLAFGSVPGFITTNVDQTSVVTINCINATAWTAGLNNGINASGTTRRMTDGLGNFVTYELYRDSTRSQRWGNTVNTDTVAGTGTGFDQAVTVYGRVPVQTATPGSYTDTITVTVTY
ncbi:Csu type fimbrial protein [Solilutibacter silvestris]|uniref:Spore Coat Protein U n=1 Tax=Solilutibacter silvestris TaxID=1645665 RepID=A0A2K1Q3F6_9GAMM|nr:spore coat protein U domain-containing protein [Lysobacter silvestris]PNS09554.1 Spore Coat Protein U [Lysobacter silvestris]